LGDVRIWADQTAIGYGNEGGGDKLAIKLRTGPNEPPIGFHLAFAAPSHAAVDRFHAEALLRGGRDNGPPGMRPDYGPGYYAAFIIDPDGYHLEAVINERA
jgi:catechol 2,3-dioxygenase-like lactoylglutathione lyase family enzyme